MSSSGLSTEKLDTSTTSTGSNDQDQSSLQPNDKDIIKVQDRFLPIANIARIMKRALKPNAKIAKGAKECTQECVSEFISFITSEYDKF